MSSKIFNLSTWLEAQFSVTGVSQDNPGNKTTYTINFHVRRKNSESFQYADDVTYKATGPGLNLNTTIYKSWTTVSSSWVLYYTQKVTVTHNTNGAPPTTSWTFSLVAPSSGWNGSSSMTYALPTIPRYAAITSFTASINDLTANFSWNTDKPISQWRYSTNSGSSYSAWITVNATGGSTSLGVSPGSTYGFRIQVINSASGLTTTSSVVSKTATKTPSTLTLSTTSQNVGSSITWTVNESYNYTHKITYAFGNTSGYILGSNSAASNTATGTWTVPIELANQIPNATSGAGTIYVYTYYGSIHIGTKSYAFTAKVPNNANFQPTATISSIVQGTTLPSGVTVYVQNKSKAKVTSSGTGKYSATIKTYSVSVAGIGTYTGSVITSDFLRNSGTVRVTLTVTDSRGLKGSAYQDINVVAYSPPKISAFTASRSESTPTNISINYNASISSVSNQNTVQYRIRSLASGGSWVVNRNVTTGYTSSESFTITSDSDKSYTIEIYVADKWASVTQTVQVGTAFTLIDFNTSGKGMAIGKVSEKNAFEVALPMYLGEGLLNNGVRGARIQFTVGGDANTYYPVLVVPPFISPDMVKLSVSRSFNEPAPNTWNTSTHRGGLTLTVFCTGYSTWSGNSSSYSVLEHAETYSKICSGIDVHTANGLIFYLRGGGASYSVTGDCWLGTSVTVHLGGYTSANGTVYSAMAYDQAKVNSSINAMKLGGGVSSVSWNDVTGKPSTFAPSSHTHAWSQVTGQPAQATRWPTWSEVTSKPSTFAPSTHTHSEYAITSGSNTNGRYIRFSDGTQICWHTKSFSATFTLWTSNFYYFDYLTKITYPAAFIAKPSLSVTSTGELVAMLSVAKTDTTGITYVSLIRPNVVNGTYAVSYVAIGRWK